MSLLKLFIFGSFFCFYSESKLLPIGQLRTMHLSQTIADILVEYFGEKSNNIAFYRAAKNDVTYQKQSDIMSEVLWLIGTRQSIIIEAPGDVKRFVMNDKRSLNIVFLDTYYSYK